MLRTTGALPRAASRAQQSIPFRRTYASGHHPPLSQGGRNRPVIIGLFGLAVPAWAWIYTQQTKSMVAPNLPGHALDPAERARTKRENAPSEPAHVHPEHHDPDLKAPFGVVHKQKRVDDPPDDRNHGALSERNRNRS
ncbi:hypothetical protein GGR52DRAFT_571882 [Hypoxylon sp. FL1284]|nr:hypothetical protein GGR52DRAFT_571882 [Hypoxylon sp. FL1284]